MSIVPRRYRCPERVSGPMGTPDGRSEPKKGEETLRVGIRHLDNDSYELTLVIIVLGCQIRIS